MLIYLSIDLTKSKEDIGINVLCWHSGSRIAFLDRDRMMWKRLLNLSIYLLSLCSMNFIFRALPERRGDASLQPLYSSKPMQVVSSLYRRSVSILP